MKNLASVIPKDILELLLLLKPHRKLFVFALVALGAGSLVNLAIPEIVRRLINSGDLSLVVENLTPFSLHWRDFFSSRLFVFTFDLSFSQ